jgi:hypothetical protein
MNAEQAKAAIDQGVIQIDPALYTVGFWCFVLLPYENSKNGTVLHYWPTENDKKRWFGVGPPERQIVLDTIDMVAICGLTNKNRWTPTTDYYNLKKLPKCKKCLNALRKIAEGE